MNRKNTDKVAEMQIIMWFLEADWEVYTPVKDQWQGDVIVRETYALGINLRRFDSVQIKHRQDDNEDCGYLTKKVITIDNPLFDCMIVFLPCQQRGLILRRELFPIKKSKQRFLEFDQHGWANGEFTPFYQPHSFDLSGEPECKRFALFIQRYREIMG